MRGSRFRLGAIAPCLYPINTTILKLTVSIDCLLNLRFRGLFLVLNWEFVHFILHRELITQFKTREKMVSNGAAGYSRVKLYAIEMRDAIQGNGPFWSPEALLLLVTTSGQVQHDGLPVTLRMVRVSLTNLIGSGLSLFCLQSHSELESYWTYPEIVASGEENREWS